MQIIDNHYKRIRDKKLVELYRLLTHSDFAGNIPEEVPVKYMYAMLCLEKENKGRKQFSPLELAQLAEDLVRADETELFGYDRSYKELAEAIINSDLTVKQIHKMSGIDLKKKLSGE